MSPPTCMVLGGHGFVGSACVRAAYARGYNVCAIGPDEYDGAVGSPCDWLVNANGNSRKYLADNDPLLDFKASVESVVRSFLDFKARRYLFCSSIDVYPAALPTPEKCETAPIDPAALTKYGFHKWLAEQVVHHYRPDALIVRMGGFVGPGLWKNAIYDLLTHVPLRVHPESSYQYMDVDVCAAILYQLLDLPEVPPTINVCGAGVIALNEVAGLIPHAEMPQDPDGLPREQYEVPIDRAKALVPDWPDTREAVRAFIQRVLNGQIKIAKTERTR